VTAANRKDSTPEPPSLLSGFACGKPDRCGGRTRRGGLSAGGAEREEHQGEGEVGNPEPWPAPVVHLSHDYGTSALGVHTPTRQRQPAVPIDARAARSARVGGGSMGDENGRWAATKTSLDAGLAAAHAHRVVRMTGRAAFQGS
jgi:hypothetical protein